MMQKYEVKPLLGLFGLLSFAFAVYSWEVTSISLRVAGAFAFLLFLLFTVMMMAAISKKRDIALYSAVVILSVIDSFWMTVALGLITMIYMVGLLFKYVMGGK